MYIKQPPTEEEMCRLRNKMDSLKKESEALTCENLEVPSETMSKLIGTCEENSDIPQSCTNSAKECLKGYQTLETTMESTLRKIYKRQLNLRVMKQIEYILRHVNNRGFCEKVIKKSMENLKADVNSFNEYILDNANKINLYDIIEKYGWEFVEEEYDKVLSKISISQICRELIEE